MTNYPKTIQPRWGRKHFASLAGDVQDIDWKIWKRLESRQKRWLRNMVDNGDHWDYEETPETQIMDDDWELVAAQKLQERGLVWIGKGFKLDGWGPTYHDVGLTSAGAAFAERHNFDLMDTYVNPHAPVTVRIWENHEGGVMVQFNDGLTFLDRDNAKDARILGHLNDSAERAYDWLA